jgi:hypothetical protein
MLVPSYFILFFLFVQSVFAATIVLKSGKQISGSIISEQESTIVVKDSHGILISVKKDAIDLEAMTKLNAPASLKPAAAPVLMKTERSLAQIARDSKKSRTGKAKAFTERQLPGGTISVMGSDEVQVVAPESKHITHSDDQWQSRIARIKKEVNALRERNISADASCETSKQKQFSTRTTPGTKPVDLMATYEQTAACKKSEELQRQLMEAETRLDLAREEGRRAGVSWQSLE